MEIVKPVGRIAATPMIKSAGPMISKQQYGMDLNWWLENSPYQYTHGLISTHYGFKDRVNREDLRIPRKGFTLLGDSGAFQALTMDIENDPIKVLRWQEANCDCAISLDVIPVVRKGNQGSQFAGQWDFMDETAFDAALRKTANNARIAHDAWRNHDMKLLYVSQGYSPELIDKSFKYLKDEGLELSDFDGVCCPMKTGGPWVVAIQICTVLDAIPKDKWFHFLGLGSFRNTSLFYYALSYRPDLTGTFDSSRYFLTGDTQHLYWWDEYGLMTKYGTPYREEDADQYTQMTLLPCDCPVCIRFPDPLKMLKKCDMFLSLHNLYMYLKYCNKMAAFATYRPDFKRWVAKHQRPLLPILDFVDLWMTEGRDRAMAMYARDLPVVGVSDNRRQVKSLASFGKQKETITATRPASTGGWV